MSTAHACPWLGECPSVVCGIRIFLTHSRNCFYQLLLYPAFTAVGDCVLFVVATSRCLLFVLVVRFEVLPLIDCIVVRNNNASLSRFRIL